jgi:hypothetical protein
MLAFVFKQDMCVWIRVISGWIRKNSQHGCGNIKGKCTDSSSSSSVGTATLVGFGLINYR